MPVLILLLVGVGMSSMSMIALIAERMKTGNANLDRWAIRGRAAMALFFTFGAKAVADPRYGRAVMAIINNESAGLPRYYLGDVNNRNGPSVGPMQVSRATAEAMGLWKRPPGLDPYAAFAELKNDEAKSIEWGVKVFAEKLRISKGDFNEAIRRYNGAGPMAEAYRGKAEKFMNDVWGAYA